MTENSENALRRLSCFGILGDSVWVCVGALESEACASPLLTRSTNSQQDSTLPTLWTNHQAAQALCDLRGIPRGRGGWRQGRSLPLVATPPQRVSGHDSVYLLELGRIGAGVDAAHLVHSKYCSKYEQMPSTHASTWACDHGGTTAALMGSRAALLSSTSSSPAPGGSVRGGRAAELWRCTEAASEFAVSRHRALSLLAW